MHQAEYALRSAFAAMRGPQFLILALALGLALVWFGPAAMALGLPFALMLLPRKAAVGGSGRRRMVPTGQMAEMAATLDHRLRAARRARHPVLCVTLTISGFDRVQDALGERLTTTCLDRLSHALRREDALFDLGAGRFGVVPGGTRGLGAPAAHRLAARLEARAMSALSDIHGTEGLGIASGLCIETPAGTRSARSVISDSLAAAASAPVATTARSPPSDEA